MKTAAAEISQLQAEMQQHGLRDPRQVAVWRAQAETARRQFIAAAATNGNMSADGTLSNAQAKAEYEQLSDIVAQCETKLGGRGGRRERHEPNTLGSIMTLQPEEGAEDFGVPTGKTKQFREAAEFIATGNRGYQATLSEGGNVQYVVPGWEVMQFLAAYPQNQPFVEAGATIFNTDDAHQLNVPIIVAGDAPTTYAEGSGPTSEQDAVVYVAKLNATKRAFLTKITEEVAQDVESLQNTLISEGIRRVARAVADAATDALVTSLTSANALVDLSGDYLQTLLDMEAAIDPTFAGPNNAFMMDRSSLSKFRNTRDLQDRPIFDPTAKTILGYKVILNDRLRGKVVFGSWAPGVYIRQTPMVVQRLLELYSESGKIGIRFQRRTDQKFFSDAATAAQAPQPLYLLHTDVGS
jgi:HK97 family phage major capsid protein